MHSRICLFVCFHACILDSCFCCCCRSAGQNLVEELPHRQANLVLTAKYTKVDVINTPSASGVGGGPNSDANAAAEDDEFQGILATGEDEDNEQDGQHLDDALWYLGAGDQEGEL